MNTRTTLSLVSSTALTLGMSTAAYAGEITGLFPQPGIVSVAGQSWFTNTTNNDNHVGLGNNNILFVLQKDYTAVGYVDIVVTVADTGGSTEYEVREGVQNGTGIDWTGYRVSLGYGVGGSFVPSTPGDGLNFDDDDDSPMDFAPGFMDFTTVVKPDEDSIVASDGDLLDGEFSGTDIVFHLEIPDGITEFTLRQQPIPVPEPGSALIMAALAGVLTRRRR